MEPNPDLAVRNVLMDGTFKGQGKFFKKARVAILAQDGELRLLVCNGNRRTMRKFWPIYVSLTVDQAIELAQAIHQCATLDKERSCPAST